MSDPNVWAWVAVGLTGLILGSFLNVVAIRLPIVLGIIPRPAMLGSASRTFNIALPGSMCMICGHQIRAIENIPLLSFAVLRGRCRHCGQRISFRYPAVESITMVVGLLLVHFYGFGWAFGAASIFAFLSLAILLIDLEHMLIPNVLVLPLLGTGLVVNTFGTFATLGDATLGAFVGYLGFWIVARIARIVFRRPALGAGDLKLFSALGAWLGLMHLPIALFIACIAGSFFGIAMIRFNIGNRGRYVPFGPFLVFGGFTTLLFGEWLANAYRAALF